MLLQGLRCMPRFRFARPELQRTNDLQPMEWGLSFDLGSTMEKCLSSTPQGKAYLALPGARMPTLGSEEKPVGGGGAPGKRESRGPPPQLDWLFVNGGLPKVK